MRITLPPLQVRRGAALRLRDAILYGGQTDNGMSTSKNSSNIERGRDGLTETEIRESHATLTGFQLIAVHDILQALGKIPPHLAMSLVIRG